MLTKEEKLRGRLRIDRVMKKGRAIRNAFFLIKYIKNSDGSHFFTVAVSKKIASSAVARNKIKRRTLHAIRFEKKSLSPRTGFDMLLFAQTACRTAGMDELRRALYALFQRLPS